MRKVIGICGREGAGKTTAADYITSSASTSTITERTLTNPWAYVLDCLFGFDYEEMCMVVPVSNDRSEILNIRENPKARKALEQIFDAFDTVFPNIYTTTPTKFTVPVVYSNADWVQITLSDPLKRVCTAITGIPYEILLGSESKLRKIRDTKKYDVGGMTMTGREVLEQVGTQVFRMQIDAEFWIKIAEAQIIRNPLINFVLPDIRFSNEYDMLKRLGGILLVIYKSVDDLILTSDDKKQHPAKWNFLEFCNDAYRIPNKDTLYYLYERLEIIRNNTDQIDLIQKESPKVLNHE